MRQVSATGWFEFAVELTGQRDPGQRQTHNDPGHDPFIEDVEVVGISLDYLPGGPRNILDGVDVTDPNVVKLLNNIADALGDYATDVLTDNL